MSLSEKYHTLLTTGKDELVYEILGDLGLKPPYADSDFQKAATVIYLVENPEEALSKLPDIGLGFERMKEGLNL